MFSRGGKLSQRTWLELRISANITKWPHMWYVCVFLSGIFHLIMPNLLLLNIHNNLYLCFLQGLHSASVPGILALDLCPSDTSKVLTGTFSFGSGSLKFVFIFKVKISDDINIHHLVFFQVELIRMWWYLTKMRSRLWQHLRVTPRRSPLLYTIHPR